MDRRLELLERLSRLTTEQIEAAKRLDGPTLAELGLKRADLSFELRCAMNEPTDEALKDQLLEAARGLKRLEERLANIAQAVTKALDAAMPSTSVVTYGRTGRI